MPSYSLTLNNKPVRVDAEPDMPLLWVIRDLLGLKGTKFGCGIAQCGACTVHLAGSPVRSCSLPISAAAGQKITTIEGLAGNSLAESVQKAWIDEQVPQCGYCQSGQIMSAVDLPTPISTSLCREISAAAVHITVSVRRSTGPQPHKPPPALSRKSAKAHKISIPCQQLLKIRTTSPAGNS
jgi:isoquinoline 1-oxidoreductase alpha subunit